MTVDEVPYWLAPGVITPELEAMRALFAEDTVFLATTIRSLRLRLDAIYARIVSSNEATRDLPDHVRETVEKLLGLSDAYDLLVYLPHALEVEPGSVPTPDGIAHFDKLVARVLGESSLVDDATG